MTLEHLDERIDSANVEINALRERIDALEEPVEDSLVDLMRSPLFQQLLRKIVDEQLAAR